MEPRLFIRKRPRSERLSKRQPGFTEILGELAGGGESISFGGDEVGWRRRVWTLGNRRLHPAGPALDSELVIF